LDWALRVKVDGVAAEALATGSTGKSGAAANRAPALARALRRETPPARRRVSRSAKPSSVALFTARPLE